MDGSVAPGGRREGAVLGYTILPVRRFGRSFSLALATLLLVLVAGPVSAARCRMSGYCPMMAKSGGPAPSQAAGGAMSAPMSCCRPQARPAATGVAGLEPSSAVLSAIPPGAGVALPPAISVATARAGTLHPLGLYTLHSVWRI
jgi:hypothetical protein